MYTLFCQKRKGDSQPFPLTEQLHSFIKQTKAEGIFVSSGYLSQITYDSAGNVKNDYVQKMLDNFLKGTEVKYFGLGNTVEGYKEYREKHEKLLCGEGKWLEVVQNNEYDHRKMVVVFRTNQNGIITPKKLERLSSGSGKKILESFFNSIEVICVSIGSSNFSYSSYYGTDYDKKEKKHTGTFLADKGEADVMMFYDEAYAQEIEHMINEKNNDNNEKINHEDRMVLSKSLTKVSNDFLKNIFRTSIEQILA